MVSALTDFIVVVDAVCHPECVCVCVSLSHSHRMCVYLCRMLVCRMREDSNYNARIPHADMTAVIICARGGCCRCCWYFSLRSRGLLKVPSIVKAHVMPGVRRCVVIYVIISRINLIRRQRRLLMTVISDAYRVAPCSGPNARQP